MDRGRLEDKTDKRRTSEEEQIAVELFASDMRRKLRKNSHKKSWKDPEVSVWYLFDRLEEEVLELKEALRKGLPTTEIIDECADVGNMAMMIADKVRNVPDR
jgi:NTP pyrophosphatase (non-canonical NTP hydrolase)